MRALGLALLLLVLAPTATFAQQEESPTPAPEQVAADDPVDDDGGEDVDGEDVDGAEDACERGGTDADYTYCGDDEDCVEGADSDYVYDLECFPSAGSGGPGPDGGGAPLAQALPASQLPLTGGEPLVLALLGAAFVLLGAGLRPPGAART